MDNEISELRTRRLEERNEELQARIAELEAQIAESIERETRARNSTVDQYNAMLSAERSAHLATRRALVDMHRLVVSVDTGAQKDVGNTNWYDARSGYCIAYREEITAARAAVADADGKAKS